MLPTHRTADNAKLRELMLYIAKKAENWSRFGSIKMNKVLFYSDFLWYADTGESITGLTYVKDDHGPAPSGLLPVQEQLQKDGAATLESHRVFPNRIEKRLVPKRTADLSLFPADQIAFVDDVMDWLCPTYAKDISKATHQHLGWRLAEYREQIPYFTVFLNDEVALPSDIQRGLELAEQHGWKTSTSP